MKPFTTGDECVSRRHCATCRDRAGGQPWRRLMRHKYDLPSNLVDFACPFGVPWAEPRPGEPAAVPATAADDPLRGWAPGQAAAMWAELHTAADADQAWLDAFTARIPCGVCKAHWRAWVAGNPPAFGAGWLEWTVRGHNAVNARRGLSAWTVEQAMARWLATGVRLPTADPPRNQRTDS